MTRGDRVELISVTDDNARFGLTAGDRGTVEFTTRSARSTSAGTAAGESGSPLASAI